MNKLPLIFILFLASCGGGSGESDNVKAPSQPSAEWVESLTNIVGIHNQWFLTQVTDCVKGANSSICFENIQNTNTNALSNEYKSMALSDVNYMRIGGGVLQMINYNNNLPRRDYTILLSNYLCCFHVFSSAQYFENTRDQEWRIRLEYKEPGTVTDKPIILVSLRDSLNEIIATCSSDSITATCTANGTTLTAYVSELPAPYSPTPYSGLLDKSVKPSAQISKGEFSIEMFNKLIELTGTEI
jgi:hypothetical protein